MHLVSADSALARCQQGPHDQDQEAFPTGSREAGSPWPQPIVQDPGNGIADRALGLGPYLMLGILAGLVCKTAKTNTR